MLKPNSVSLTKSDIQKYSEADLMKLYKKYDAMKRRQKKAHKKFLESIIRTKESLWA